LRYGFGMISITLKGVPKDVHEALKKRAAVHRRSLNNEVIFTLESSMGLVSQEIGRAQESPKVVKTKSVAKKRS
jgi:plasmid stability protein